MSAVNRKAKYCPSWLLSHSRDKFYLVRTGLSPHKQSTERREAGRGEMDELLCCGPPQRDHSIQYRLHFENNFSKAIYARIRQIGGHG